MRRKLLALIALSAVVIAAALTALVLRPYLGATVALSAEDLQRSLERGFPKEKGNLLLGVRFSDPTVSLPEGRDVVGLGITTRVSAIGLDPVRGRTEVEGRVRYEPTTRELFLDRPRLTRLTIEGLPASLAHPAEELIGEALISYLERMPLYRLRESDLKRLPGTVTVRSAEVTGGRLVIRFGL